MRGRSFSSFHPPSFAVLPAVLRDTNTRKNPVVTLGQKFKRKETDTIYIVKIIKGNKILLISEDGKASMLIQVESLALSGLEPI